MSGHLVHRGRASVRLSFRLRAVLWAATLAAGGWSADPAGALDHVTFRRDGQQRRVSGMVLVEAQDGGLLLMDQARALWTIPPEEQMTRERDAEPFESFDREQTARVLLQRMPGFRVHKTANYVICYNTSPAYARWCGALFERLYRAFHNYWGERGFEIREPQWPLVALVFNNARDYAAHSQAELGAATGSVIGYYSLTTNQVTTFDLTGADVQLLSGGSAQARINFILSRPQAERTVATIIHEATHQLAFNCGLQTRYADIPLWVSEGVAIYFETPDLRSSRGWSTIGQVNRVRNADFRRYLRKRPSDSLKTLIATDKRLRDPRTAPDAYAEAWALNYYLLRARTEQYQRYIKLLSEKKPLLYDDPGSRWAQFQQIFGEDLQELDAEFLRYMQDVR